MLNMWPCGWSRRKNCCRCLKSASRSCTETGELVWACLALRLRMQIEVWQPEVAQDEQKLIQLLGAAAGPLEQVALGLHPDWPGLCLLAHKRTEKHMMTWRTCHNTEQLRELSTT